MSHGLGFMVRYVRSHIYLTNQCMYVCMDALLEVGTSYMDMPYECMYIYMYVCEYLSEQ